MKSNNETTVYCKKCAVCIYTEFGLFVVCAGPCRNSYHMSCVGISKEQLRAISSGLLWLCSECRLAFNDWRNDEQSSTIAPAPNVIHADILELKTQVSTIMDTLHQITLRDTSDARPNILHSTPVETADVMNGTNDSYKNVTEPESAEQYETTTDAGCFSLFLSNIDSSATDNDVKTMVYRCLSLPAVEHLGLIKLVSKHMDCRLLDYVSFKVILDQKWKDLAMQASTWPPGIRFREFRHSTQTWKP